MKHLQDVLQDECFGKNYSSFLDLTRSYDWTSGIFVPFLFTYNSGQSYGPQTYCYKGNTLSLFTCLQVCDNERDIIYREKLR